MINTSASGFFILDLVERTAGRLACSISKNTCTSYVKGHSFLMKDIRFISYLERKYKPQYVKDLTCEMFREGYTVAIEENPTYCRV